MHSLPGDPDVASSMTLSSTTAVEAAVEATAGDATPQQRTVGLVYDECMEYHIREGEDLVAGGSTGTQRHPALTRPLRTSC